jgi:hypothetical protein
MQCEYISTYPSKSKQDPDGFIIDTTIQKLNSTVKTDGIHGKQASRPKPLGSVGQCAISKAIRACMRRG